MKKWPGRTRVVLLLLVLAAALALVGQALARKLGALEQIDLLVDLRHEIVKEYVEEPDQKKMIEQAVRGMVDALDDPYTVYLTPEELAPFDQQIRGTFTGIGAEVQVHDNFLRIVTPLDDSPAWKAGIIAGDTVLEIDGKSTERMSVADSVKRLQGPEGSKVMLKVRHAAGGEALITVTRAQINVQTVRGLRRDSAEHWDFMLDPAHAVGYIRISQFTETTAPDVKAALLQLKERHCKALVLDLRFDPGGLLDSAVAISDMFLPAGKRIVSTRGRTVPESVRMSTGAAVIDPVPMVVLANESSASASEIVTGALADNGRARFVGTRTFGKGSVQQVRMLESGEGAIKITNAYYYLPNGRNIHRRKDSNVWGVDPDDGCYVPMTPEQVQTMVQTRHEGDILRKGSDTQPASITPEYIAKTLSDPQLAAALTALLGKLKDDKWPVVGLSNAQALAIEARRDGLVRQLELIDERRDAVAKELTKLDHAATQPATLPGATTTP